MKEKIRAGLMTLTALLILATPLTFAKVKVSKLAKKLLYGDEATRMEAVKAFNKLPADEQYKLVPDFMVALTDDDPQVRKIASRILKVLGVKTEAQIPDAKKEMPAPKELMTPPPKPAGGGQWTDLENMRQGQSNHYDDLKQQIEQEKKGQVTLDATELRSESDSYTTPLSTVIQSLKDPDPWVRAQAARRLALVHPAPVQTIPTLIHMLDDKDPESRRAAAAALGSFGPLAREAVPALSKTLADPDNSVSQIAAEALKQIQQP